MKETKLSSTDNFPTPTLQWNDILRVLGSIAGFVGVAGALLWLFGRFFYGGVFAAFGFPSLAISLAPEDYLERGAAPLVYLLIDVLIGILLYYLAYVSKIFYHQKMGQYIKNRTIKLISILIVFFICIATGVYLLSSKETIASGGFFFEDLTNLISILLIFTGFEVAFLIASPHDGNNTNEQTQNYLVVSSQTPIAIARILMLVIMLANLVFTQAWSSYASGKRAGCISTLTKSASVVIFSTEKILAEGQSQSGDLYQFDGYYLLFIDNNNYYLFRNINPETNKPQSYFIINKEVLKAIQVTGLPTTKDEFNIFSEKCTNN